MKTITKYAAVAAMTGALAIAAVTPSQARDGALIGAGAGFIAGAAVGAAAANANAGYYGPGYYSGPDYAYEPGPAYYAPAPQYYYGGGPRYRNNSSNCTASPASGQFGVCGN